MVEIKTTGQNYYKFTISIMAVTFVLIFVLNCFFELSKYNVANGCLSSAYIFLKISSK